MTSFAGLPVPKELFDATKADADFWDGEVLDGQTNFSTGPALTAKDEVGRVKTALC
jgi:hypothetical protein